MKLLLIGILIILSEYTFGQYRIKGVVSDSTTDKPLEGVKVVEKNLQHYSLTDTNGVFTVFCTTDKPILVISKPGFTTKKIIAHLNGLKITLQADTLHSDTLRQTQSMGSYCTRVATIQILQHTIDLVYQSGINYTPLGFTIGYNHYGAKPMGVHIGWRTNTAKNSYLALSSYISPFKHTAFLGRFTQLKYKQTKINQWNIGSGVYLSRGLNITLGYTYQDRKYKLLTTQAHGLYSGIDYSFSYGYYNSFFSGTSLSFLSRYVDKKYQFSLGVDQSLFARLALGINYEKTDSFREFVFSLSYRIYSKYKAYNYK